MISSDIDINVNTVQYNQQKMKIILDQLQEALMIAKEIDKVINENNF